jgi:hypothetical protein
MEDFGIRFIVAHANNFALFGGLNEFLQATIFEGYDTAAKKEAIRIYKFLLYNIAIVLDSSQQ